MSALLELEPEQRAEAFRVAEQELGLPDHVLEKDLWVTYSLAALFQGMKLPVRMMFKGGTSLSKCYSVIERFSEDIDLALDREDLGFDGPNAPETQPSANQAKRKLEALKAAGTRHIVGMNNQLPRTRNETKPPTIHKLCCLPWQTIHPASAPPAGCLAQ